MNRWLVCSALGVFALLAGATPGFAGGIQGAPAPLLGAGLPGLAVLAVTGVGYLAVRMRRRR
jgi:hypothetical protein